MPRWNTGNWSAWKECPSILPIKERCCAKGAASRQYVYAKNRLKYPMIQRGERGSKKLGTGFLGGSLFCHRFTIDGKSGINMERSPTVFFAGYPKWYRPFSPAPCHCLLVSPNFCTEVEYLQLLPYRRGKGHLRFTLALPIFLAPVVFSRGPQNPFYTNATLARNLLDLKREGPEGHRRRPQGFRFRRKRPTFISSLRPGNRWGIGAGDDQGLDRRRSL